MKIRRAEDERVRGAEGGIPGLVQPFTFGFYFELRTLNCPAGALPNVLLRITIYDIRNTIYYSVGRASSAHV